MSSDAVGDGLARSASRLKFKADTISDQKRFARGEHWLMTRSILRARDGVHHKRWRTLILSGGSPNGEINCIRELMPKAVVVAADNNSECLDAAIEAGADDVVLCDLTDWSYREPRPGSFGKPTRRPHKHLIAAGEFDAIHLDLCGPANQASRDIVSVYPHLLTTHGVMMVTFSYGRDVAEMYQETVVKWERGRTIKYGDEGQSNSVEALQRLRATGCPESVIGRICYLLTPAVATKNLRSIVLYRGAQMPMCSLLIHYRPLGCKLSFAQTEPGDFELAVVYPSSVGLYDCPQDRIEGLRRKFAALKASLTRVRGEVSLFPSSEG